MTSEVVIVGWGQGFVQTDKVTFMATCKQMPSVAAQQDQYTWPALMIIYSNFVVDKAVKTTTKRATF